MDLFTRVTISCFGLSYAIAWLLEMARLFFRVPLRAAISNALVGAGLFAHTLFLIFQARVDLSRGTALASWHDWCLIAAWLLVVGSLYVGVRFPKIAHAPFLLPIVLALIGLAGRLRDLPPFSPQGARSIWSTVHGLSLLVGTVTVSMGFLAGLMYLIHSAQLKSRKASRLRLPLPSLERLQSVSEQSLVISTALLAVGLLSGILVNLMAQRRESPAVQWSDPVVWTSGVLLTWLAGSLIFQALYRPARHGRKVAYLVVSTFLFLVLELGLVLAVSHGTRPAATESSPSAVTEERAA